MVREENITLDRVCRILDLLDSGVSMALIRAAVCRSSDGYDLGALIGLIEDMRPVDESGHPLK